MNDVIGAFVSVDIASAGSRLAANSPLCVADGGGADAACGASSRSGKIVCCPDARKMPPPVRLGLAVSRACFASLKDAGFAGADAGEAGVALPD